MDSAEDTRIGREALAVLAAMAKKGPLDHNGFGVASIYAALDDHERAIVVLEKALEKRSILAFILVDPRLDPLRADPRFRQLLRRANIPS
jgi:hypothetical protein